MEDVFLKEICSICKNKKNCNGYSIISQEGENFIKRTYCTNYIKDESKIVPYEQPLIVTAEKDYVKYREI